MIKKIVLVVLVCIAQGSLAYNAESPSDPTALIKISSDAVSVPSLDFEEPSDEDSELCDQAVAEKMPAWRLVLQQLGSSAYAYCMHGKHYVSEKWLLFLTWVKARVQ